MVHGNSKIIMARLLMLWLPPLPGTQGPPFVLFIFDFLVFFFFGGFSVFLFYGMSVFLNSTAATTSVGVPPSSTPGCS